MVRHAAWWAADRAIASSGGGAGVTQLDPPVLTCSSIEGSGLDEVWSGVEGHRQAMTASGELAERRRAQTLLWMQTMLRDRLLGHFDDDPAFRSAREALAVDVGAGRLTPTVAVDRLIDRL